MYPDGVVAPSESRSQSVRFRLRSAGMTRCRRNPRELPRNASDIGRSSSFSRRSVVVVVVVAFFVVVPRRRKSESVRDGDVVDAERDARTRARAGTTRGIADIDRGGRVGVFRRRTRDE